jgi:hypothetical protein
MSSHHFVKEQQEPAVFILDAENIQFDLISGLLEWVPTILVSEKALDQVLSWGIKIDVILASTTFQKENLGLLEAQFPVKFLSVENGNFLNEGIQYLLASKHEAVHLVGVSHQSAVDLQSNLHLMNLTLVDGNWKYYPVKSGKFKKWFAESSIHIHGKEGMPLEIKNSEGEILLPITYATMIEVPEGITEINAPGIFWIGEEIWSA